MLHWYGLGGTTQPEDAPPSCPVHLSSSYPVPYRGPTRPRCGSYPVPYRGRTSLNPNHVPNYNPNPVPNPTVTLALALALTLVTQSPSHSCICNCNHNRHRNRNLNSNPTAVMTPILVVLGRSSNVTTAFCTLTLDPSSGRSDSRTWATDTTHHTAQMAAQCDSHTLLWPCRSGGAI